MERVAVDGSSGDTRMTVLRCCEETAKGSARDSLLDEEEEEEEEGSELALAEEIVEAERLAIESSFALRELVIRRWCERGG